MPDKPLGDPLAGPTYKGFAATPEPPRAPTARPRRRRGRLAGAGVVAAALAAAAGLTLHHPSGPPEPPPARPLPSIPAAPRPLPVVAPPPAPPPPAELRPPATTKVLDIAPAPPPVAEPPRPRAREPQRRDSCGPKDSSIARILCEDPQIASLDREVNAAFAAAMRESATPGQLAIDQESWILRRDRTAREDPEAIGDLYRERIAVLQDRTGETAPGGERP